MKRKGIIIKQTEDVISIVCDVCGKIHEGNKMPNDWITVRAIRHYYDDIDYDDDDACSPECYLELLKQSC